MPFGSCGPSKFLHVSCVSASSRKCIVREGLGSISHIFFRNFLAEIVALHIIQPPHEFRTKTNQRTARATERRYNFAANQLHFVQNDWKPCSRKSPGTRLFALQLKSRPAIILKWRNSLTYENNKAITKNIVHHQEKNFQVLLKARVSLCPN